MQKRILILISLAVALVSSSFADDPWRAHVVQNTFDNCPFNYLEKPLGQRPGYKIVRLKYPSPITTAVEQNNTVPADYYLPEGIRPGDPKRPAVICLHILDGNDVLTDMLCSALAARGIPAIMFKLPYYGERGFADGPMALAKDPKLFASAIEQTGFDMRRTFDLLASRPEIDPKKISIAGISMGGIIAASAAGGEPRLHRAALLLSGGDLMTILHHALETKPLVKMLDSLPNDERTALEAKIKAVDPLRFAPGLRDRAQKGQVLMINAAEDEVIPKRCTEKLADALAIPDKIVWLDGLGHYTSMAELPATLKITADFFAHDLPSGVSPPSQQSRSREMKKLAGLLQQASALLAEKPKPGKCHAVALSYSITPRDQEPLEGRLRFLRDSENHFALSAKLPIVGEVSLGQGVYPWIVSNNTILTGTEKSTPALKNSADFLGKKPIALLRMAGGLLKSVSLTPEVLLRFVEVAEDPSARDGRVLTLTGKPPFFGNLTLTFANDGQTLATAEFALADLRGIIRFHEWQINVPSHAEWFAPPAKLPVKATAQSNVYQMFAALRNLAALAGIK